VASGCFEVDVDDHRTKFYVYLASPGKFESRLLLTGPLETEHPYIVKFVIQKFWEMFATPDAAMRVLFAGLKVLGPSRVPTCSGDTSYVRQLISLSYSGGDCVLRLNVLSLFLSKTLMPRVDLEFQLNARALSLGSFLQGNQEFQEVDGVVLLTDVGAASVLGFAREFKLASVSVFDAV